VLLPELSALIDGVSIPEIKGSHDHFDYDVQSVKIDQV
jgi:hypothetical protein